MNEDELQQPVVEKIVGLSAKQSLFAALWSDETLPLPFISDLNTFYSHYSRTCHLEALDDHDFDWTHAKLLDVAKQVRRDVSRDAIISALQVDPRVGGDNKDPIANTKANKFIDLVARLTSLLEIEDVVHTNKLQSNVHALRWQAGSLKDVIGPRFQAQAVLNDEVKLEPLFNALNIERISGIKIRWTSNIAEHLELFEDDSEVAIFHLATFLNQQRRIQQSTLPSLLSEKLTKETLDTLSLLLPKSDKTLSLWYRRQRPSGNKGGRLDPAGIKCDFLKRQDRRIEHFEVWRDRLIILKQAFDCAEPKGITQWWYDRRKRVQWYTFWVAIWVLVLTVMLGFGQLLVGILQVNAAYRALKSP